MIGGAISDRRNYKNQLKLMGQQHQYNKEMGEINQNYAKEMAIVAMERMISGMETDEEGYFRDNIVAFHRRILGLLMDGYYDASAEVDGILENLHQEVTFLITEINDELDTDPDLKVWLHRFLVQYLQQRQSFGYSFGNGTELMINQAISHNNDDDQVLTPYWEISFIEETGHDVIMTGAGDYQFYPLNDIAMAVECFIARATSENPETRYKESLTLQEIINLS